MRHFTAIASSLVLLLAGCGSGGEDPPDLFVGTYWNVALATWMSSSDRESVSRIWGRSTSDGAGGIADVTHSATDEVIEVSGDYTLGEDHRLGITIGAWGEEGGLDALGRCAVTHHLRAGTDVGLSILLARIGAFDDGTLAGTYHLAGAGRRPRDQGSFHALSGSRLTFDGNGGYTASPVTVTERGWFREEEAATGLVYEVASDGELTMVDHTGVNSLHGGVLAGGEVAVGIGGDTVEQDTVLYALVRTASGLSAERLFGNYWAVAIERTPDGFRSAFYTLTADGAGTCWLAGRENRDGVVGTADSFEGSYTVAPDGALTLTLGDGTTLVGGLSRDGQFFAAAGGAAEGDAPHFLVAVAREYGVSR